MGIRFEAELQGYRQRCRIAGVWTYRYATPFAQALGVDGAGSYFLLKPRARALLPMLWRRSGKEIRQERLLTYLG